MSQCLRLAQSEQQRLLQHNSAASEVDTVRALERQLEEIRESCARETKAAMDMNFALLTQHKQLEATLSVTQSQLTSAVESRDSLALKLLEQEKEASSMRSDLGELRGVLKCLAKKLVGYKAKLQAVELPMCRFTVFEITRKGKFAAELAINKNPATHSLELRITRHNKNVVTAGAGDNNDGGFTVNEVSRNGETGFSVTLVERGGAPGTLRFESENCEQVVRALREFLRLAA
eukprot:c16241_g1_i4.p2 GENE.c16241_g1_i4~~c16241_g1_i4.p2  ORF type:complete len:233 (+),score=67.31 c16241_g1_i4:726-1424(+)